MLDPAEVATRSQRLPGDSQRLPDAPRQARRSPATPDAPRLPGDSPTLPGSPATPGDSPTLPGQARWPVAAPGNQLLIVAPHSAHRPPGWLARRVTGDNGPSETGDRTTRDHTGPRGDQGPLDQGLQNQWRSCGDH